jgi:hypothetical protein
MAVVINFAHQTIDLRDAYCALANSLIQESRTLEKRRLGSIRQFLQATARSRQKATAANRQRLQLVDGYPDSTHRKMCMVLGTYRHSARERFENANAARRGIKVL